MMAFIDERVFDRQRPPGAAHLPPVDSGPM